MIFAVIKYNVLKTRQKSLKTTHHHAFHCRSIVLERHLSSKFCVYSRACEGGGSGRGSLMHLSSHPCTVCSPASRRESERGCNPRRALATSPANIMRRRNRGSRSLRLPCCMRELCGSHSQNIVN